MIRTHASFRLLFFARERERKEWSGGDDGLRRVLADCQSTSSNKKKEKKKRKQAEQGTPAVQPPTTRPEPSTHPEHTSDGAAEKKAGGGQDESSEDDEDHESSPPRENNSTLAERAHDGSWNDAVGQRQRRHQLHVVGVFQQPPSGLASLGVRSG